MAAQQQVFKRFTELVKQREMTFPKQVVDELTRFAEGDLPGLWVQSAQKHHRFDDNPPLEVVKRVLSAARDRHLGRTRTVVDPMKTHEDADPYVLAHAVLLKEEGHNVTVVTNDRHNTLTRLSMVTACQMLKLQFQTTVPFLRSLGFKC